MWYDCVLLDADGTLLDYDAAEEAALTGAFSAWGMEFSDAYLRAYRAINARVWEAYERRDIDQRQLGTRRFGELFAQFGVRGDPEAFGELYLERLGQEAQLIPGSLELLEALHGHIVLVLLTNGIGSVQRARLAASRLDSYFNALVISGELDVAKPDPRIFAVALERVGNPPPGRVLMVGDNLRSDIGGAHQAGLASCWFNAQGASNPHPYTPTYEIRSLDELKGILGVG